MKSNNVLKKIAFVCLITLGTIAFLFGVLVGYFKLPVSAYYLQQNPNCGNKILPEIRSVESYGFAMYKKDTDLKAKVDAALAELKKNGEYEKIYMKWFKQKPQV